MKEASLNLSSSVLEKTCPPENKSPTVSNEYALSVRCTSFSSVMGSHRLLTTGRLEEYRVCCPVTLASFFQAQLVVDTVCMSQESLGNPFGRIILSGAGSTKSASGLE